MQICRDVLAGFANVAYMKCFDASLDNFLNSAVVLARPDKERYKVENTVGREIDFICRNLP
jgi:hypothetical protein